MKIGHANAAALAALAIKYHWYLLPRLKGAADASRAPLWWTSPPPPAPGGGGGGAPAARADVGGRHALSVPSLAPRSPIGTTTVAALRADLPRDFRTAFLAHLKLSVAVIGEGATFTRHVLTQFVTTLLAQWNDVAGGIGDAPPDAPAKLDDALFKDVFNGYARAPALAREITASLAADSGYNPRRHGDWVGAARLSGGAATAWAAEVKNCCGPARIHGLRPRLLAFLRLALLRACFSTARGDGGGAAGGGGGDARFAKGLLTGRNATALATAATQMVLGITHFNPPGGGAPVALPRSARLLRALALPAVAGVIRGLAVRLWGDDGGAAAVTATTRRLAPALAAQPATALRCSRLLHHGALVWRSLRLLATMENWRSAWALMDVAAHNARAGPRALLALLRAERALAALGVRGGGDEDEPDFDVGADGNEVLLPDDEELPPAEVEAEEAAAARELAKATSAAATRADRRSEVNTLAFPFPNGLNLPAMKGVDGQALGSLVSGCIAANPHLQPLDFEARYASPCDYWVLPGNHMGEVTVMPNGEVRVPRNFAPPPPAAAAPPPPPPPPPAAAAAAAGGGGGGGPAPHPLHAKIFAAAACGPLRPLGCDPGVQRSTFAERGDGGGLVAYELGTRHFHHLAKSRQFTRMEKRLLARLTPQQAAAARRPTSFAAASAAVRARLAAPAPAAVLRKLAAVAASRRAAHRRALDSFLQQLKLGSITGGTARASRRIVLSTGTPSFLSGRAPVRALLARASTILRGPSLRNDEFCTTRCHNNGGGEPGAAPGAAPECWAQQQPVFRDARGEVRALPGGGFAGNKTLVERLRRNAEAAAAAEAAGQPAPELAAAWAFVECGGLKYCPACKSFTSRDINAAATFATLMERYLAGVPRPAALTLEGHGGAAEPPPFYLGTHGRAAAAPRMLAAAAREGAAVDGGGY